MLTHIANVILSLLLLIIVWREREKFSITTTLWCIILALTAVIIRIIDIIQSW